MFRLIYYSLQNAQMKRIGLKLGRPHLNTVDLNEYTSNRTCSRPVFCEDILIIKMQGAQLVTQKENNSF